MNAHLLRCLPLLLILAACNRPAPDAKPDFLTANIDSTVSPAQDFFLFANGGWIKRTPIPDAESSWGLGNLVDEEIYNRLKTVNEDAEGQKTPEGSVTQKIADFWFSSMDTTDIDKMGLMPLQGELGEIRSIRSKEDLVAMAAKLQARGIGVLFSSSVSQDDKNSAQMAFQLYQGGLGMPNRDYYFNTDTRTAGIRKAYEAYLIRTFEQLGSDSVAAMARAAGVVQLETKLAKASRKLADLRDPYANYHKMSLAGLKALTPDFDWAAYLKQSGMRALDSVIVGQPEYFSALNAELTKTSLSTWKDYMNARLVSRSAAYLDSTTFYSAFAYSQTLSGVKTPKVRWKRAIDAEQQAMGEALGQLFVKEFFSEKAKQRYSDLIENIRSAF